MIWNTKTPTGREKLLILNRKLDALFQMEPDLIACKPYSFFPYMSDDCVLRSEKLPEPLTGQAVRDFLIREKRSGLGFSPMPEPVIVESEEDGEILLRIRPRFGDEKPDGELVRLELNAEGKVCEIVRFDEKKLRYRKAGSFVSLTPARVVREGDRKAVVNNDAETVRFSGLYYDEMALIFDMLPECPQFTDMEDRNMDLSDWTAILNLWKEINESTDFGALRGRIFRAEEEILKKYRWYAEELEELIRNVWRKREPYGRRMQAWLEDWLNGVGEEYQYIRKC